MTRRGPAVATLRPPHLPRAHGAGGAYVNTLYRDHGPWPDGAAEDALTRVVSGIRDGAVVLVDGLIASARSNVLVPETRRLALVVLSSTCRLATDRPEPELGHASYPRADRPRLRERHHRPAHGPASGWSTSTGSRQIGIHVAEPGALHTTLSPGT
jgi:hypothetical protein